MSGRPATRLIARFAIVWLAVLGTAAAVFALVIVPRGREAARAETRRALAEVANVRSTALEAWARDAVADARTVAGFPTARVLVSPRPAWEADPRFTDILDRYATLHDVRTLTVLDRALEPHASTTARLDASAAVRAFARRTLASGRDSLELLPDAGGRAAVYVAATIGPGDGVVVAEYDPERWLYRLLGTPPLGASSEALLVRRAGGRVVALSPGDGRRLRPLTEFAPPSAVSATPWVLDAPDGFARGADDRGQPTLAWSRAVPGLSWRLVVAVSEARVLASTLRGLRFVGLVSALLLTALVALAFALVWGQRRAHEAATARQRERLNRLLRATNAVAVAINREDDERALFATVCRQAVEAGGFRLAVVALGRPGEGVEPAVVACEWPLEIDAPGDARRAEVLRHLPAAEAMRRGQSVRVPDVLADPSFAGARGLFAALGVRSCTSSPIRTRTGVRGAFTLCAGEPGAFDVEAGALIESAAAELGHAMAALEDRRARARIERQLVQTQKLETIGQLAGGVAHDFNNLLTVIHGYADLLRTSASRDPEDAERIEQILRAAERASGLTRQLLAFGRRQVLAPRVLDLRGLLAEADTMLRQLLGAAVEIRIEPAAALGHVMADPVQIEQVLLNLLVNARDAMPNGGRVRIQLADANVDAEWAAAHPPIGPGRYVRMSVSDDGSGIPPEAMPHIFEPFFTTKADGRGTGLGLATVYGIVRQSGGHVFVSSRVGEGTTFDILLPRVEPPDGDGERAGEARAAGAPLAPKPSPG